MARQREPVDRLPPGHSHELPDPRRATADRLEQEVRVASESPVVTAVLEMADAALMVLNAERQVVAFNSRVAELRSPADLLGRRPGEILDCTSARAGGCGQGPACSTCGALGAILAAQQRNHPVEADCLIQSDRVAIGSLELNVRATPVVLDERTFTVVSLRDVSGERRREALEQVFFHDVLNTVQGLRGWAELLRRPAADVSRASERIDFLTREIEREIGDHRAILHAENGTLVARREQVATGALLRDLAAVFSGHPAARERRVEVGPPADDLPIVTDRTLLVRVLVNMLRNALEATEPGHAVRLACRREERGVRFLVHNDEVIPEQVQVRIFQRSFSTKAARGRGLGTYSMKLFGERYLGGEVSFVSTPQAGTEFSILLPREPAGGAG